MMLLGFTLDDWRCALELSNVERIYRAAAITPLPDAPDVVLGIVNVSGVIVPVVDIRLRFGLPTKILSPDDLFVIAHASGHRVALIVDEVTGVITCAEQDVISASDIVPGIKHIAGVVRLNDGMILIHDLAYFLLLEEKAALEQALGNL